VFEDRQNITKIFPPKLRLKKFVIRGKHFDLREKSSEIGKSEGPIRAMDIFFK